jgi:hypothetical protein
MTRHPEEASNQFLLLQIQKWMSLVSIIDYQYLLAESLVDSYESVIEVLY